MGKLSRIPTSTSIELAADTNVIVDVINDPVASGARLGKLARLAVPITVLGELFYGAEKSARTAQNLAKVEDFIREVRILSSGLATARCFGKIHRQLRLKGKPIPESDRWIAAAALEHGLPLVTRDKHFQHVDDIEVVLW